MFKVLNALGFCRSCDERREGGMEGWMDGRYFFLTRVSRVRVARKLLGTSSVDFLSFRPPGKAVGNELAAPHAVAAWSW